MFRKLTFIATLLCVQNLFAVDCVDGNGKDVTNQPEIFTVVIEKSQSCYEATQLAEACAWGSSLDVSTAGTAYSVCEKELKAQNPGKKLSVLLSSMNKTCEKKYENEEGTMYRSMNAYCKLSAIEWILNIATQN